jgi:mutator protein MutT
VTATSGAAEFAELQVAVGVLQNPAGQVLISQRPASGSQPGAWEFPGGKLTANETPLQALQRELNEELAIQVRYIRYLADVQHEYSELKLAVHLYCWKVLLWDGTAEAAENQALQWVEPGQLSRCGLLEADQPLIDILTGNAAVNTRPCRGVVENLGWLA